MEKATFIYLIICSLLLSECRQKCDPHQLPDKNFTQEELIIIPYTGTEKITFKNIAGDSVCFTGQGKVSSMYQSNSMEPDEENDYCRGDFRMAEDVSLTFIGNNSDTSINVHIGFITPFGKTENYKSFSITIKSYDEFYGYYMFEAGSIMTVKFSQPYHPCYVTSYYDSLTLVNKTYLHVFELTRDISNVLPQYKYLQITNLYYSFAKGIVGYKKYSGTIWYLD